MTENQSKDKKVLALGLILILGVALITYFRSYKSHNKVDTDDKLNANQLKYSTISPPDLLKKIKNKDSLQIIDIRSADLYEKDHIEDSINIPIEQLKGSNNAIDKNKTVIILDQAENRINLEQAIKLLQEKGLKNILVLSGGISNWKENYNPSVSQGNPYSFVDQSKVTFIKQEDAKKVLDEKVPVFLLDIRDNQQFSTHLPGAVNIPLNFLEKRKDEIPAGKEIIVYGESELEGFQAGVRLHDLGYYSIYVLKEGFQDWREKGYPVE